MVHISSNFSHPPPPYLFHRYVGIQFSRERVPTFTIYICDAVFLLKDSEKCLSLVLRPIWMSILHSPLLSRTPSAIKLSATAPVVCLSGLTEQDDHE